MTAPAEEVGLGEGVGGGMEVRIGIFFYFEGFFFLKIVGVTCGNGRICIT